MKCFFLSPSKAKLKFDSHLSTTMEEGFIYLCKVPSLANEVAHGGKGN